MKRSPIQEGTPFSEERTREIIRDFKRDGFDLIPNVLEPSELSALRDTSDALFEDPAAIQAGYVDNGWILRHTNELDRIYCDLLVREPILGLMEAIFGRGVQQCGMNVLRNDHTKSIEHWHVDDALFFPLPEEVPHHDPRIEIPILWLTVQVPLSDIDTLENGPTQYVPGSHYSGRHAPKTEAPEFEGRGPETILCKAGDIYLHNPQCWHRGTPNRSGRVRYLLQQQYGPRWAFPRFNAYIRHQMPEPILEGASERLLSVLGNQRFHPEARYRARS